MILDYLKFLRLSKNTYVSIQWKIKNQIAHIKDNKSTSCFLFKWAPIKIYCLT